MTDHGAIKLDQVGYWSEIKLDIVKDYARAYSTVFHGRNQSRFHLHHSYIDAFAGPGVHISRSTKEFIPGSPTNALLVNPPFKAFHLIDLDGDKINNLKQVTEGDSRVRIYEGDCNQVLVAEVFPQVLYKDYRRALCLLDPYGLQLKWEVIEQAGQMGSIDMFLNFPIMDMNRNALRKNHAGVAAADLVRMTAFWGDDSWHEAAYHVQTDLFGEQHTFKNVGNNPIVNAFSERLKTVAGFEHVPQPLAMRNSIGAVVYYLFFASHKPVAQDIVEGIFKKYRSR